MLDDDPDDDEDWYDDEDEPDDDESAPCPECGAPVHGRHRQVPCLRLLALRRPTAVDLWAGDSKAAAGSASRPGSFWPYF